MNQCLLHLSSESEKMLLVALGKGFMRIKLNLPAFQQKGVLLIFVQLNKS
jgi:hypothetical protein